jgi:DnaJ-domain-containing protein 1
MDDPLKRATVYRLRAEETRTAADGIRHQTNRDTLLRIADDYDLMAEGIEQRARGVRDRKKGDPIGASVAY